MNEATRIKQILLLSVVLGVISSPGHSSESSTDSTKLPHAYQAIWLETVGTETRKITEVCDGKRFIRTDTVAVHGKYSTTNIIDFTKGEIIVLPPDGLRNQASRELLAPYLPTKKIPKKGVVSLGAKQIDGWKCHGYRLLTPFSIEDMWLDDKTGFLVQGTEGGFPKKLVRLEEKTPDASVFAYPKGLKELKAPAIKPGDYGIVPFTMDPKLLPKPGKQSDGSIVTIKPLLQTTTVTRQMPDGSRIEHVYGRNLESESWIDGDEYLLYQWIDTASSRRVADARGPGPLLFDDDHGITRRIRKTFPDGSFILQDFNKMLVTTLEQEASGKQKTMTMLTDGGVMSRTVDGKRMQNGGNASEKLPAFSPPPFPRQTKYFKSP